MKAFDIFSASMFFCSSLLFASCNDHVRKENINGNSSSVENADSAYSKAEAERDSISAGTTVTPTASARKNPIDSLSKVK